MPVTWDTAHLLNLAVTDVRDAKTESGIFFRQFIKRCNVFNHVLSNGKGFAFLQLVNEDARRPVSYATQRFASSSYEQWMKIEKSFNSLWRAFDLLHPNRAEDEEWQYMIAGSDFVQDLLAFLDILSPVVDLMLHAQALDTPIWKLKLWWPKGREKLMKAANEDPEAFPRLKQVEQNLRPSGVFKGVTLLSGWLVTSDRGKESGEERFNWATREDHEIKDDHKGFAKDLKESLEKRVSSVLQSETISNLEVFDATNLVNLHCGTANDGKITFFLPEGEIEEYGVDECKELMKAASKLSHIQASGKNFDSRMSHPYMGLLKKAVSEGVWNGFCPDWFEVMDEEPGDKNIDGVSLVEFRAEESINLESVFVMRFSNGVVQKVRLSERCFYKSFYSNKDLYDIVQPPSCALLDIALAKGGPEAIAESFYNSMRHQQQSGGQSNSTLVRRTKVNWCLPSLKNCESIIKESVCLYLEGDNTIKAHRVNSFFSSRANKYDCSKVVDRVQSERGRCPFLVTEPDLPMAD